MEGYMHTALIGLQWGDEGKGKLIDYMANSFDCICRYQGGANAGHTVIFNESKISLHLIPSGIFHRDKICIIGNGVVIDIKQLEKELKELIEINIEFENRFFISKRAHIIQPGHFIIEKEMAKEISQYVGKLQGEIKKLNENDKKRYLVDINEKDYLGHTKEYLKKVFSCAIEIFSTDDSKIFDPANKSRYAIPLRPAIYVE